MRYLINVAWLFWQVFKNPAFLDEMENDYEYSVKGEKCCN